MSLPVVSDTVETVQDNKRSYGVPSSSLSQYHRVTLKKKIPATINYNSTTSSACLLKENAIFRLSTDPYSSCYIGVGDKLLLLEGYSISWNINDVRDDLCTTTTVPTTMEYAIKRVP
jgi:hypothetical protein